MYYLSQERMLGFVIRLSIPLLHLSGVLHARRIAGGLEMRRIHGRDNLPDPLNQCQIYHHRLGSPNRRMLLLCSMMVHVMWAESWTRSSIFFFKSFISLILLGLREENSPTIRFLCDQKTHLLQGKLLLTPHLNDYLSYKLFGSLIVIPPLKGMSLCCISVSHSFGRYNGLVIDCVRNQRHSFPTRLFLWNKFGEMYLTTWDHSAAPVSTIIHLSVTRYANRLAWVTQPW